MKKVRIIVSGRVQGVSFRYYTKQFADKLNLKGSVKNLPNGTVEVIAEGKEDSINQIIDFCKKGPSWAHVEKIIVEEEPETEKLKEFKISF